MRKVTVLEQILFLFVVMAIFSSMSSVANAAPKGEPIVIGAITNISAPYGASLKASMEIAVDEINNSGGILGRPVKLVIEDWKRQVPLALAAYKKLVMQDKCVVVFTEGSEAVVALVEEGAKLFKSYPHIQMAQYASSDDLTLETVGKDYEKYKFFFRGFSNMYTQYTQALNLWEVYKDVVKAKKVALIIEDIAYTKTMITGKKDPHGYPPYKEFLESKGFEVVLLTQVAAQEKMFLPTFELVAKSGAELMVWAGAYANHQTVAKQWQESAAKDVDIISFSGASGYKNFMAMTNGGGLGWIAQFPEINIPYTSDSLPFLKKLEAKGVGLMVSTYIGYDGPFLFKEAIEKIKNPKDMLGIIKFLETTPVKRAFWSWQFDKYHDPIYGYPYFTCVYGQHQGPDKFVVIFPEKIRQITNPKDKFIPVKELRKMNN
jgi:branched-chain amino acid transport system substrate-binding protein